MQEIVKIPYYIVSECGAIYSKDLKFIVGINDDVCQIIKARYPDSCYIEGIVFSEKFDPTVYIEANCLIRGVTKKKVHTVYINNPKNTENVVQAIYPAAKEFKGEIYTSDF